MKMATIFQQTGKEKSLKKEQIDSTSLVLIDG